jgi:hypothetical protein
MVGAGEGDALIGSTADFTKPLDYSRMQLAVADTQAGIDVALRKRDLADAFEKVTFNDRR